MLLGSVQICGEKLSTIEMKDICESLEAHNVRLLSLRECKVSEKDFKRLMKAVGVTLSALQLNLNLGMVTPQRVESLSRALTKNRSLTSLFLHGSPLGDRGAALLCKMIATHPHIVSLDLGDCSITDAAIPFIADLLPPNGAKKGLEDLVLSANPGVTSAGWTKLIIALSASCCLKTLSLDYNKIGDYGAGCLSVALPTLSHLEILDLEGTGITQYGGEILLYTIRSYPVSLKQIILAENTIRKETVYDIELALRCESGSTLHSQIDLGTLDDKASTSSLSTSSSSLPAGTIISKHTVNKLQQETSEDDDDISESETLEEDSDEEEYSDDNDDDELVPIDMSNMSKDGQRNDSGGVPTSKQVPSNREKGKHAKIATSIGTTGTEEEVQQAYADLAQMLD